MDERELKNLISLITEKVMERLGEPGSPMEEPQGAMVIVPAYVPDAAGLTAYLKQAYGEKRTDWLLEGTEPIDPETKTVFVSTEADKKQLLNALKTYSDIVLAVPPLWMLAGIGKGEDTGIAEQALLKAVLWKKNVTVLIDFEKPKFRRGTFFETLSDTLKAIEDMGVGIVSLPFSVKKKTQEKTLVTEADIVDVARSGEMHVKCVPGAIVTPLARDRAKELDVTID